MTTCFHQMHHHLVALALCVPLASATIEIAAGSATGALILSASQVATISLIMYFSCREITFNVS